jgi:hypothetical protein
VSTEAIFTELGDLVWGADRFFGPLMVALGSILRKVSSWHAGYLARFSVGVSWALQGAEQCSWPLPTPY